MYPTYQEAMTVTATATFGLLRDGMACLFLAGYGDGLYPVFGKFDETGRIVEVIIDMQMTESRSSLRYRTYDGVATNYSLLAEGTRGLGET